MQTPWQWLQGIINANTYDPNYIPDESGELAPYDMDPVYGYDNNLAVFEADKPTLGRAMTTKKPNKPAAKKAAPKAQPSTGLRVKTTGNPTARTTRNGKAVSRRTAAMLDWASKKAGLPIVVTSGSFQNRNTHRGDAVDLRTWIYTPAERVKVVHALKDAGFAAWYRPNFGGDPNNDHIHAIPIGGNVDSDAAWQIQQYHARRSGLTSNAQDTTYRPPHRVIFDFLTGQPKRA